MENTTAHTHTPKAPAPMSPRKEMALFLLIPTVVICLIAGVLWLPSLFARPKYSFIYSYCPDYTCAYGFMVKNEHITKSNNSRIDLDYGYKAPKLYYYDVQKQSSRPLDEDEVQAISVDSASVSHDGYRLTQSSGDSGGFLFWGGYGNYNWYLKNGMKKKQVNLTTGSDTYNSEITFLGWVRQ
jgi:hypothetical protein